MEGDIGTIGITPHAADALGDIVFVDLPAVGTEFKTGDSFGSIESVKAASDVYIPIGGEVVEINNVSSLKFMPSVFFLFCVLNLKLLERTPGAVNDSALDLGWFMKIKVQFVCVQWMQRSTFTHIILGKWCWKG